MQLVIRLSGHPLECGRIHHIRSLPTKKGGLWQARYAKREFHGACLFAALRVELPEAVRWCHGMVGLPPVDHFRGVRAGSRFATRFLRFGGSGRRRVGAGTSRVRAVVLPVWRPKDGRGALLACPGTLGGGLAQCSRRFALAPGFVAHTHARTRAGTLGHAHSLRGRGHAQDAAACPRGCGRAHLQVRRPLVQVHGLRLPLLHRGVGSTHAGGALPRVQEPRRWPVEKGHRRPSSEDSRAPRDRRTPRAPDSTARPTEHITPLSDPDDRSRPL